MTTEEWQRRIEALESKVRDLESDVHQRAKDAAYVYIHSNWTLVRWYLAREQDNHGENPETYSRAKNAERLIQADLPRNLRAVYFEPQPMDAAYRWRIETTVILNQNGYTFFD